MFLFRQTTSAKVLSIFALSNIYFYINNYLQYWICIWYTEIVSIEYSLNRRMNMIKKILSAVSYVAILSVGVSNAHYMPHAPGLRDKYTRNESGVLRKSLLSTDEVERNSIPIILPRENQSGGTRTQYADTLSQKNAVKGLIRPASDSTTVDFGSSNEEDPFEVLSPIIWIGSWNQMGAQLQKVKNTAREIEFLSAAHDLGCNVECLIEKKRFAAVKMASALMTTADNMAAIGRYTNNQTLWTDGQSLRYHVEEAANWLNNQLVDNRGSEENQIKACNDTLKLIYQAIRIAYDTWKNNPSRVIEPYRTTEVDIEARNGTSSVIYTKEQAQSGIQMLCETARRVAVMSDNPSQCADKMQVIGKKAETSYTIAINLARLADALGQTQIRGRIEALQDKLDSDLMNLRSAGMEDIMTLEALYSRHLVYIARLAEIVSNQQYCKPSTSWCGPITMKPIGAPADLDSRHEAIVYHKETIAGQFNILLNKSEAARKAGNVQEQQRTLWMIANRLEDAAVALEGTRGVKLADIKKLKTTAGEVRSLADGLVPNPTWFEGITNYGLTLVADQKLKGVSGTMQLLKNFS
jgi:hypothetical protein